MPPPRLISSARHRLRAAELAVLFAVWAYPTAMWAAGSESSFPLGSLARSAPTESILFAHWTSRPADGFSARRLSGAREALAESGFLDAYVHELGAVLEPDLRQRFEEESEHWKRILTAVDWWGLIANECLLVGRVGPTGRFELALLSRVGSEQRDRHIERLKAILYGLCAVGENLELELGAHDGVPAIMLYSRTDFTEQLCVTGVDDVVAIGSSMSLVRKCIAVGSGRGLDHGLVVSDRYSEARAALDRRAAPFESSSSADSVARLELRFETGPIVGGVADLDVVSSWHLVAEFDGAGVTTRARTVLSERTEGELRAALVGQPEIRDLLARLPARAVAFSVSAGLPPAAIYDAIARVGGLFSSNAFFGEDLAGVLGVLGLDRDTLAALTGRRSTFSLPAPSGGVDHVLRLESRPGAEAAGALTAWIERLAERARVWDVRVERVETAAAAGGLWEVAFPLLDGRIALGVVEGALLVATSRAGLEAAITPAGDRELPDWIPATGSLDSASDGDWDGTLESAAWCLRLGGLIGTLLPDDGESGVLKPLCVALPRLSNALRRLEFLGARRGLTFREGEVFLHFGRTSFRSVARF